MIVPDQRWYCPNCGKRIRVWADGRIAKHGPKDHPCGNSGTYVR